MRGSVRRLACEILLNKVIPSILVQRLKATYTWPGENASPASITTFTNVSPWLLCIVIAHARRNGNCEKVPSSSSSTLPDFLLSVYLILRQRSFLSSIVCFAGADISTCTLS